MKHCPCDSGGASAGSVTGGRGQGLRESLTVTEVSFSLSLCSLMGIKLWEAKPHSRERGERHFGQLVYKLPSLNNYTVSQYPWGHLLIGCLIFFFLTFKQLS